VDTAAISTSTDAAPAYLGIKGQSTGWCIRYEGPLATGIQRPEWCWPLHCTIPL